MCIMAAVDSGVELASDEILERCWDRNPHGGGFAYVKGDKILVYKTLDKNKFIEKIKKHRGDNENAPMIWHMRAASHGLVSLENVHPFKASSGLVFAHNGHISRCDTSKTSKISDTNKFNQIIMTKLPTELITSDVFDWLARPYIGHSKLLILSAKEGIKYVGKDRGMIEGKTWYSNDMYKKYEPKVYNYWNRNRDMWDDHDRMTAAQKMKCPCCNKEVYFLETLMMDFDSVGYAFKMCYSCWQDYRKSWKLEQVTKAGVVMGTSSFNCSECGTGTGNNSINILDIEDNSYKVVCPACFVKKFVGTTAMLSIDNGTDADEMVDGFKEWRANLDSADIKLLEHKKEEAA